MKKSGLGRGLSALIPEGGVPGTLHPLAEGLASDPSTTVEMEVTEGMRFEKVSVVHPVSYTHLTLPTKRIV